MKCVFCLMHNYVITRKRGRSAAAIRKEVLSKTADAITVLGNKPLCFEHFAAEMTSD